MSAPLLLALRIALIVVLYVFIAWVFSTLWRDLKKQSTLPGTSGFPAIQLVFRDNSHIRVARYTSARVAIGRDPACELCLDDKTISVRHAQLSFNNNQWWGEDLQSTNGTFLNQDRISIPMVLASGDRLQCGQVVFTITIGDQPASPPESSQ